ncbi:MAG: hypothetical protein IPH59_13415 [bacterium]|nr:hypothetical protein [bacterium]
MAEYPKRKSNLLIQVEKVEGIDYYTVKSPDTGKFIRLREPEYYLINLLDGNRTPEEAAEDFVRTFNTVITGEAISQFAKQLGQLGFLEGVEATRKESGKSALFIKLKAFDPDNFLNRWYPRLGWLFSPVSVFLLSLFTIVGMIVFFANIREFPFSLMTIFSAADLVSIIASLFVITVIHEYAHAFACKRYGGDVHEMGFLLIYFQPAFFCNLSDAYLFPNKRQRFVVMFAGIFFQLFLWALFTVLWRMTIEGYPLNRIFYWTSAVCFATLVFNLNPAIKLDGYYLLADYLQIPNLRQKSFNYIWTRIKVNLFGCRDDSLVQPSNRERKIYRRYGAFALLYSSLLIVFIVYRGGQFFVEHWAGFGFLLFLALVFLIFKRLIKTSGSRIMDVWRERKVDWMKPKRVVAYGVALVIILALAILIKIEQTSGGEARLVAAESFVITRIGPSSLESSYFRGGIVEESVSKLFQLSQSDNAVTQIRPNVSVGEAVAAGDTLLVINSTLNRGLLAEAASDLKKAEADRRLLLSDPKVEAVATKRSEIKEAEAVYEAARKELNRVKELHNPQLISEDEFERASASFNVATSVWNSRKSELKLLRSAPKAEEVEKIDAEIEKLRSRVAYLDEQLNASVILSPFAGIIVGASNSNDILHLARTDSLVVEVKLDEADLDILSPGSDIQLRVHAFPSIKNYGKVIKLKLSPSLMAVASVANSSNTLLPEMTGYAKVSCGKVSLASLSMRKVTRFFRLEFWSWF